MTPAVQNLVDGVMHLLHYKDDALVTESILPQLIAMLNSSDPNLASQATGTIYSLAKKEAPRHALVSNRELCPALALVLLDSNCEAPKESVLFYHIFFLERTDK